MNFIIANNRAEIAFCKEALFAFRTNLDEATYVDLVMNMITYENFKLVYIPNDAHTGVAAFVGYRVMHTLRTGWMIYIDDLYTDPACRGKGNAGALLDYVDEDAGRAGIRVVHLDSGYMLHDAHRLYLNKGYVLACNHFAKALPEAATRES